MKRFDNSCPDSEKDSNQGDEKWCGDNNSLTSLSFVILHLLSLY